MASYHIQLKLCQLSGRWGLSCHQRRYRNIQPANLQRRRAIDIQFKSRALALSASFAHQPYSEELVGVPRLEMQPQQLRRGASQSLPAAGL